MSYAHIHAEADQNVYAAFRNRFLPHSKNLAVKNNDGRSFTYGELDRQTAKTAGALRARGVKKGDRVAGLVNKSPEAIFLYLAAARLGAIFIPMNVAFRAGEVEHILCDAKPTVVVCTPDHEDNAKAAAKSAGVPHVLTMDESGGGSFAAAVAQAEPYDTLEPGTATDTHALVYTSGTTGKPKGAMLTNGLVIWNTMVLSEMWGFTAKDVLLHVNPYAYSLFGTTNVALVAGTTMLLLPKFVVDEVIALLPSCTAFLGVPTHYARLLQDKRFDAALCKNIRLFVTGSAPMRPDIFREFERRTGQRMVDRYGLTENLIFSSTRPEGPKIEGTSGAPLPDVEVKLIDENHAVVPEGEVGIVAVKGPYRFNGYWGDEDKTRRSYTADGFLITGDFGKWHPSGQLSILGRGVDLIISGGFNVFPKEVEDRVNSLPNIKESAVIGVPHPDFGEAVIAVVEAHNPSAHLDEADLIGRLKKEIANYKVPKRIIPIAEMPRTALGKIQKNVLKSQYSDLFSVSPVQ